jgi:hypothetical protein
MKPATIAPAVTPIVAPIIVDVCGLLLDTAEGVGAAVAEVVGESGAAVITTTLTTVEACPTEFDVMEVKVWVDDSSEPVAPVVTVTVAAPE